VSGVFVAVGSVPNSDLLKELVKLDNGYVVASEERSYLSRWYFCCR